MSFETLNLTRPLLDALTDLGFTQPTPIQEKSFSVIMSGRDVVGIAQTGTGKTFAYLLPILRQMKYSDQKDPRVIILVPTRELVVQLVGEIKKLTTYMKVRVEGVYGGTNINTQKDVVTKGVDIIVATPGRLMDLCLSRILLLSSVRQLVIDEMDEILNLGFRNQLTTILDLMPRRRQHLLYSATMTEEVDDIIRMFFNPPQYIEIMRMGTPLENIAQSLYRVPNFNTKLNLLEYLLKNDETMQKVLVFAPSKRVADRVYEFLDGRFPEQFGVIHSNKSQNFRLSSVQEFADGTIRGLIATDILARGLDIHEVTHVINIDMPSESERYIHRIGRTGRADMNGIAISFVTDPEINAQIAVEILMNMEIPVRTLPEDLEISHEFTEEERNMGLGPKRSRAAVAAQALAAANPNNPPGIKPVGKKKKPAPKANKFTIGKKFDKPNKKAGKMK